MGSVTAISKKDIDFLENSLKVLSDNMNSVAGDVVDINGQITDFNNQVDSIKANVKSLEQEIRDFMFEVKGSTLVNTAQNDIIMLEQDLTKKFGHYTDIRRKFSGIVSNFDLDLNYINKKTLLSQSEQSLLTTPDYYLSYALVALCAWFRNERKAANKALNKALKLNESKTSLLFCLIHLRLERHETAYKWMKRYLQTVNPKEMDNLIISVLDSLTNNAYDTRITDELLTSIESWCKNINNDEIINNKQIDRWASFFSSNKAVFKEEEFPFLFNYVEEANYLREEIENAYTYNYVYSDFINLIEKGNNNSKNLDELLKDLLSSYESSELELRKEILKNKIIVECKGDQTKADKLFNESMSSLNEKTDFSTGLTNIIFDRDDVSDNTKKFAIALSKENILKGLEKALPSHNKEHKELTIKINEWTGKTLDGSNEKELQESLTEYVKNPFMEDFDSVKIINTKTLYCIFFAIAGVVVCFFEVFIGLLLILCGGIAFMFFANQTLKMRDKIMSDYKEVLDKYLFELNNVIAEIVDIKYYTKRSLNNKDNVVNLINSYYKDNFISGSR